MQITPYLDFDGRCEEALEFYRKNVGAEIGMKMRFDDNAEAMKMHPQSRGKILHSSFKIGGVELLASDSDCGGNPQFQGVSLAITVTSADEAQKIFAGLSDGGSVTMPLSQTFFAKSYGQVKDRFGIAWMVMFVGR